MSQTSLSIASASSPGDLHVTYFTETAHTSPARSGATPSGSPVEFPLVTNRKFDRLMPARRTPVGARSEIISGGKGMCWPAMAVCRTEAFRDDTFAPKGAGVPEDDFPVAVEMLVKGDAIIRAAEEIGQRV